MTFEIEEIEDKEIWENFISECEEKTFLQSWNWGEFQKMMGNKIWRLGIYEMSNLITTALLVKIQAKRGTFLFLPHGPNIKNSKSEILNPKQVQISKFQILKSILEELKKIAKEEKADFIRIVPMLERNEENREIFKKLGFRESPMHANAYETSWKLDITLPEGKILMNMRKTTRYLIRQTMKNPDIKVQKSENLDDIKSYQELTKEVVKRQKFVPFSSEFIRKELEIFLKDKKAALFFGKYKGEINCAALVIFWSGIGFYHQAASGPKYAKLSIPYLILWEAIKEARKRECILFDFWGYVDPKLKPEHPWAGPTLFKMGFGGYKKEYLKTQDFPLSKKYWLTYIFEKLRKTKRGL